MRIVYTSFIVLLTNIFVFSAQPTLELKSDTPEPKAGDLITVTAVSPEAKNIRMKVVGDASYKADTSGRSLYIVPRGKVVVLGVASDAQGELSEIVELVLLAESADPDPPEPKPGPKPDPEPEPLPGTELFWIVIVEETGTRSVETAKVFNDQELRKELESKGHFIRWYDQDSPKGKGYKKAVTAEGLDVPSLLLFKKSETGAVVPTAIFELKSSDDLKAQVKKAGGK